MTIASRFRLSTLLAAALALVGAPAFAATATVLHVFSGRADGTQPTVGVTMNDAGVLFGTTLGGGTSEFGVVFQLVPPAAGQSAWSETILHQFTNGADGGSPWAPVTLLADGKLLGSTLGGGSGGGGVGGFGELWQLAPPAAGQTAWTETTVHDFTASPDGEGPIGGLLPSADGGYYGVTSTGGTGGFGSVYKLTPPADSSSAWTTTVIYSFTGGDDGRMPQNRLIADKAGHLYGTTEEHGAFGGGAVFELSPPVASGAAWTETSIWGFSNGSDGGQPRSGLTMLKDGSMVGTTYAGGNFGRGVAYRLVPPAAGQTAWTQQVLHTFTGHADGGSPDGGLTLDGQGGLYGTASQGGTGQVGEVFHMKPIAAGHWKLTTVQAFAGGASGGGPTGDLLLRNGRLYGVTLGDPTANAMSVVYEIAP